MNQQDAPDGNGVPADQIVAAAKKLQQDMLPAKVYLDDCRKVIQDAVAAGQYVHYIHGDPRV